MCVVGDQTRQKVDHAQHNQSAGTKRRDVEGARLLALIAKLNQLIIANGVSRVGKDHAVVAQAQTLVELVLRVGVDLRLLELALLHQHVVEDERHHEHQSCHWPGYEEDVDNDAEEARRDAAAQAGAEARVDVRPRCACRQAADYEEDEGQASHHGGNDDYNRL